jgi:hypothetical protein
LNASLTPRRTRTLWPRSYLTNVNAYDDNRVFAQLRA